MGENWGRPVHATLFSAYGRRRTSHSLSSPQLHKQQHSFEARQLFEYDSYSAATYKPANLFT